MQQINEQDPEAESAREIEASQVPQGLGQTKVKRALTIVCAFVLALVLGLFVGFLSERAKLEGRVKRGVTVEGIALEGLNRADLKRALAPLEKRFNRRELTLTAAGKRLDTQSRSLGFRINTGLLIEQALKQGRRGNLFSQFFQFGKSLFIDTTLHPELELDEQELTRALDSWTSSFLIDPVAPSLSYDKELQVRYAQPGETVNVAELRKQVEQALMQSSQAINIELPRIYSAPLLDKVVVDARADEARVLLGAPIRVRVEGSELQTEIKIRELGAAFSSEMSDFPASLTLRLDVEKLRGALSSFLAEVERPQKNASFEVDSRGKVSIVPSEPGLKVDNDVFVQRILDLGNQKPRVVLLPLVELAPTLTTSQAEELGVVGLVSSFSTFHACCQPRVDNIHAVAQKIDGVIVAPGDTFSLNQFLGPRIGNSDYKSAPTIVHGEMQETTGGGISQFATTFFNALLDGGYEIVQRQPHSFYFSRYPEGHEATISFPEPDLIFKNDTEAGVLIKTQFGGTFIKVLLYGNNGGRKSTRHKSKRFDYVKPATEYEPDPEMDPEKQKRLYAGQIGWSVMVSRTIRFPDNTEKKEQRKVIYNARPEVVRTHPCNIPEGAKGHTGEKCPEPERDEREEELSDEQYFDTAPGSPLPDESSLLNDEGD